MAEWRGGGQSRGWTRDYVILPPLSKSTMPPKSIFRQPGAKHFQLVHRSQRDPLIHDPDASQQVLKPVERENAKKVIYLKMISHIKF